MKLRINKLLSDAGIGSRRDVEQLIRDGRVIINGREAGLTDVVGADDEVLLDDMDLPVADLIREAEFEQTLRAEEEEQIERNAAKLSKKKGAPNVAVSRGPEKGARKFEKDEWDRQFSDGGQPSHRKPNNPKRQQRPQENAFHRQNKGRQRNHTSHPNDDD